MRLLRGHVGQFKEDLQLETSAGKLLFKIKSAAGFSEAVFNAMMVNLSVMTRNKGEQIVLPKMSLRDVFNISQVREGFFKWGTNEIVGAIDLSRIGSVNISDGDYFVTNYEGFPADAITDVYAIDAPVATNVIVRTEEITITGTVKDLNVSNKVDLFIPVTDENGNGIDSIQLEYGNKTVTYTEDELKALNFAINDVACVIDEQLDDADGTTRLVKFGYDRLLWLDISNALRLRVVPKTKTPVVIYTCHDMSL